MHALIFIALLFLFINTFFSCWNFWWQSLCLNHFFNYFQFFVFGLLTRKYNEKFINVIEKDWVRAIVIIGFFVCLFVLYKTELCNDRFVFYFLFEVLLVRYLGLLSLFLLFYNLKLFFAKDNLISKGLTYIGKRTYDIYLLHYFFIPSLFIMRPIVECGILIEFVIVLLISMLTILASLMISRFIRCSHFFAHYLFGVKLPLINKS